MDSYGLGRSVCFYDTIARLTGRAADLERPDPVIPKLCKPCSICWKLLLILLI